MNNDYLDFINDLNGFVREENRKQKENKNDKFDAASYFRKPKDEPTVKDVKMDLDSDGQLLKKWVLRKIKKEHVFIKNEYMDYAIKNNVSKTKAEKLLKDITEDLGLTKNYVTKFSIGLYPALNRIHYNAIYYK